MEEETQKIIENFTSRQKEVFLHVASRRNTPGVTLEAKDTKIAKKLGPRLVKYNAWSKTWSVTPFGREVYKAMTRYARYPHGHFPQGLDLYAYEGPGNNSDFDELIEWARENLHEGANIGGDILLLMYLAFQVGEDAGASNVLS